MRFSPRQRRDRPPREAECPSGSVECLVCGRAFTTLGTHLRTHGVTAREYRARFPGAVTTTAAVREAQRLGGRFGNERLAALGGRRHTVTYAVA